MPGNAPAFDNEIDGILLYLVQQRDGLRYAAYGLTEEQLRAKATPASALTVGGLIKHAARTERGWIDILTSPAPPGSRTRRPTVPTSCSPTTSRTRR